jgi:drug/metabolite transporter (DMT)-like permease
MDNEHNNISRIENVERLKEIPKWARRYAQNRTLTILVLMVMLMLFSAFFAVVVSFLLVLAAAGFRKGNIILGCVGIGALVALLAAYFKCLFILIRKFGGKNRGLLDRLLDQRLYAKEGMVSVPKLKSSKKKVWLEIAIALVYGILFFGTWYLGAENYIPAKYVQPISALYCVPYMVVGWYFWRSPRMGPIYLLSPTLYAVHAILIVAGVPIFFTGPLGAGYSMFLPLIVYGLVPFIVGHIYSRYALKKLKGITHLEGEAANGD